MSVLTNLLEHLRQRHVKWQAQRPYKRRLKKLEGQRLTVTGHIRELTVQISNLVLKRERLENDVSTVDAAIKTTKERLNEIQ